MVTQQQFIDQWRGIRNDEDDKQISPKYFYKIKNYNFPDTGTKGLDKILMPERFQQFDTVDIDGLFEYRYLDDNNVLQTEYIVVTNGTIRKTDLTSTDTTLKSGLNTGKVSFAVFNDKLFIANGLDNVQIYDGNLGVVTEMGAPFAEDSGDVGNLNGAYYYALTYTTAGGEEILGSVSNTITVANKKMTLTLPIGYSGTLTRTIYRTKAGGSTLYKVADIADNTTLTYTDNIPDASLVSAIAATNNALPKPYFLEVTGEKLFGFKVTNYPTQVFPTAVNIEVFDSASFIDVANYGADNTPIEGGGIDYSLLLIGTNRNVFLIDPSNNSVVRTRANVGIKSGYSTKALPAFANFPGGLMFLSTENDVRLMRGQTGSIPTTVDDVSTENWAQVIRGDLNTELSTLSNVAVEFYKYKYHLVLNDTKYVFDIRVQEWTEHYILTDTSGLYSRPRVLAVLNGLLYNGQADGWVEKEYATVKYRDEDVEAYLESPYIASSDKYKYRENMKLWFIPSSRNTLKVNVITDDNAVYKESMTFSVLAMTKFDVKGGEYNQNNFSENYFNVDLTGLDYRVININRPCRWYKWTLSNTAGNISLRGITYTGQPMLNKEGGQ